jgi:sensor histidine kinase regulating citrate/malate metabolism
LEVQNTKNEILEKSLQDLEKSFAMWKGSVHDYKHAILYMEYLVSENRIDELQQYLQSENEKLEQNCHYYKTGNSMLDVVVNTKYKVMQEKNILFMSDIDVEQTPSITELDLGILLGNLLDNAIEAAESCEVAYVSMAIKYRNSLLEIEITNSYRGETPDFQTTKENKCFHGIGLQSVEKIVERYEGCICTECSREEVTVKTALPC